MLSPPDQISRIEARKRKLADEMDRLDQEMDKLNAALEVIRLLEKEAGDEVAPPSVNQKPESTDETTAVLHDTEAKLGPLRPSGCPTNYQMVDMILAGAEKEGKEGLTVSEIISEIRKRYWPGLKDPQVSAPIYAFVRKGRFKRLEKGRIGRVKDEEGSTAGGPQSLL